MTITEIFPALTADSTAEDFARLFAAHPNQAFALNYPSLDKNDPRVREGLLLAARQNPEGVYEAIQLRGRLLPDPSGLLETIIHDLCANPASAARIAPLLAETLHLSPENFAAFVHAQQQVAVTAEKDVVHTLPAMQVQQAEAAIVGALGQSAATGKEA